MSNSATYKAQSLLYTWISNFEKRSYSQIKEACNFLNTSLDLNLGDRPVVYLLYPLLYSGVVDYVGRDYYALTKPIAIDCETHIYAINCAGLFQKKSWLPVGWSIADKESIPENVPIMKMNTLAVLKSFPRIDHVIATWDSSLQDVEELSYHDYKHHVGVAEYRSDGHGKFFSIPEKSFLREIPPREKNPDAYRIAVCYERNLTGKANGTYNKKIKTLRVQSFAFPFLLYRALLLDALTEQKFPREENGSFIFENISPSVIRELNRILCKSIRYE